MTFPSIPSVLWLSDLDCKIMLWLLPLQFAKVTKGCFNLHFRLYVFVQSWIAYRCLTLPFLGSTQLYVWKDTQTQVFKNCQCYPFFLDNKITVLFQPAGFQFLVGNVQCVFKFSSPNSMKESMSLPGNPFWARSHSWNPLWMLWKSSKIRCN